MTTIEELMKELKDLTIKVESFIKSKEDKEYKEEDALKKNKFKLVVEKVEKKVDSESSDDSLSTDSCPISESRIDFFPTKYRTTQVNLNSNNIVITRPDKIIEINY
jgi:hypothetical protein